MTLAPANVSISTTPPAPVRVTLSFDLNDPLAFLDIAVANDTDLKTEDYLGRLKSARARLTSYISDFEDSFVEDLRIHCKKCGLRCPDELHETGLCRTCQGMPTY